MKRKFPVVCAQASNWVASPLIIVASLNYLSLAISSSASEFLSVCMSSIGLTAGLAALCFRATSATRVEFLTEAFQYAGEKFFHSVLLLIQVLAIVFVKQNISRAGWVSSLPEMATIAKATIGVLDGMAFLLGASAAWSWYWAFTRINEEFWENWKVRVAQINESSNT